MSEQNGEAKASESPGQVGAEPVTETLPRSATTEQQPVGHGESSEEVPDRATSTSPEAAPPPSSAPPSVVPPSYGPAPYEPAPGYFHPPALQSGDGGGGGPIPPTTRPTPPSRSYAGLAALLVAIGLLIAAGAGVVIGHVAWTSTTPVTAPLPTTTPSTAPITSSPGAPSNAASIAAGVDPAVVDINTTYAYQATEGAGTGMVLSSGGEILTNNHVIEDATSISVTDVGNAKTYDATVVGYDVTQDIAVLQLTGSSGLKTVTLGNSSNISVGEGVVAIGNAEGAGGTPSYASGSVTALDQSITAEDEISHSSETLSGLIETNADVVPGDSGGPLVNSAGQVLGMDTAGSEGFQFQGPSNEGYAIPINEASAIARQIEASQSSSTVHVGPTAFLGVEVQAPVSGIAGAQIVGVVPDEPAAQAGLGTGDTITAIDGQSVSSPESLTDLLLGETPGASVQVQYLDPSGMQHSVSVQLASGPAQ